MTLEDYRIQLVKRIVECAGPHVVRDLVTEAHEMLIAFQLQPGTVGKFWRELRADLEVIYEEILYIHEPAARALRGAVITAAQVALTPYQNEVDETVLGAAGSPSSGK
jgi:hypothetical protein